MLEIFIMFLIFWFWENLPAIYVHRDSSHRQCTFHPALVRVIHVMKWLRSFKYNAGWERLWAAAHRKHHAVANTETSNDPHSPYIKPFWFMVTKQRDWLTEEEIENWTRNDRWPRTKFDDLLERFRVGPYILLAVFLYFFSWPGIILWLACLATHVIPGYFNYCAHVWPGYINAPNRGADRSRNLFPFMGLIYGGEEIHGNHHRWPNRVNFAVRWWEIDLGYALVKLLSWVGLVKFNYPLPPVTEELKVKFIK